jgi:AraC family transcriptional regulator, transcriptional activator of pobA
MSEEAKRAILVKNKIKLDAIFKAEPFRKGIRVTKPHKHNQYFEIVYLSRGSGTHWIDGIEYSIKAPVLFFINRNQTHHWEISTEPDGYVLILKQSFFQYSKDEILKQLLQQLWHANCVYPAHTQNIDTVFKLLCDILGGDTKYNNHSADGLLKTLIALILNEGKEQFHYRGLQTMLYIRYIDLLHTQLDFQRKLQYYTSLLGTTPQNLNAACRKTAAQSAAEILDNFVINEAKRLLLYSSNNVNEIAFQLHFNDPSYFVKFFKKYEHITPDEYRKTSFQNYHL